MKLYRNAIILVVVLGLVFGAYMLLKDKIAKKDAAEDGSQTIRITDYSDDKIKSITVENPDGTFIIEKKDKTWTLTSPTDFNSDSSKVSSIVTNAESVIADKLVEENPKNLSMYGLDKPVTLTIKLTDGTDKVILLGNKTPTGSGYYALDKAVNKVYVLDTYTSEKLLFKKNDIRSTALYTVTSDKIITLAMDRDGSNVFKSKKLSDTNWSLTSPIECNANSNAIEPMLTAISGVTVSEFVESNAADLDKYGLAKPKYVFDFSTSEGSYKLQLGAEKTKGSLIYAKLDGSNEVYAIDESAFTFLDKPFNEIVEAFVYIVNIDQVNKIELDMDGKKTVMGIETFKDSEGKADADKDKFTVDGKDASGKDANDDQPFRTFYQDLVGISMDSIDVNAKPAGNAEITVTYYLKSAPGTMKVEFLPKDAENYYVVENGKYTGMVVSKTKDSYGIKSMRSSYKTLMEFVAAQK